VTVLQSLAIKLVMLAVTIGVLYWALNDEGPDKRAARQADPRPAASASDRGQSPPEHVPPEDLPPKHIPVDSFDKAADIRPSTPPPPPASATTRPSFHSAPAAARRPVSFPINLNTAQRKEFMELPGIGEQLAERILQYRKAHGAFRTIEQLREVKGIGKKRMDRLRPLVTVAKHD
jgi:competence protein ComEA